MSNFEQLTCKIAVHISHSFTRVDGITSVDYLSTRVLGLIVNW